MKRKLLPLLLSLCVLLSACGKSSAIKSAYDAFAEELSRASSLSFNASVRAEYEHKTARFALSYAEDDSGGTVTVVAPQIIAGISAHVAKGSTRLDYGDISLDTGALDEHGLSPMSSLPLLVQALRSGYLDSFWEEDGSIVLQLIPNDDLICTVWFDTDMTPLRAELISGGRVVIYADITDWTLA